MQLPIKIPYELMLTRWASILNPLLKNPINQVSLLKNVSLSTGENQIAHKLGRTQQGWFLVDIDAAETVYRSQSFNENYLYLTASGDATVSIGVF